MGQNKTEVVSVRVPGLLELGAFDPASRSGPAVWLKCAIAGVLPEVQFQGVPVVYPGSDAAVS